KGAGGFACRSPEMAASVAPSRLLSAPVGSGVGGLGCCLPEIGLPGVKLIGACRAPAPSTWKKPPGDKCHTFRHPLSEPHAMTTENSPQSTTQSDAPSTPDVYRDTARENLVSDEIQIDDDALVSISDDRGAYVRGWDWEAGPSD